MRFEIDCKVSGAVEYYYDLPDCYECINECWYVFKASGMYLYNRKPQRSYYKSIDGEWKRYVEIKEFLVG